MSYQPDPEYRPLTFETVQAYRDKWVRPRRLLLTSDKLEYYRITAISRHGVKLGGLSWVTFKSLLADYVFADYEVLVPVGERIPVHELPKAQG